MTTRGSTLRRFLALALAATLAGCGLKGALTLPEKSENVVIRGQEAGTAAGQAPATTPAKPKPDKMPPPELPRSTTGM